MVLESNRVYDVKLLNGKTYNSKGLVLVAGAIETPRIFKSSGIEAGKWLFVGIFIKIGGLIGNSFFN